MCGRYVVEADDAEIREIINEAVKSLGEETGVKTGEIFPANKAPVIIYEDNKPKSTIMEWGFPNFHSKGVIINARAETVLEKRTFKDSMFSRRCVIPATGFYEWKENKDGKTRDKYLFTLPHSPILYLAGFYNIFDNKNKFIILTTVANESMAEVHDRMPLVLSKYNIEYWVNNTDFALDMLNKVPPDLNKVIV